MSSAARFACRGFTIMEIAICLAIIGFALVAIIGVLPYGMNTQKANREETIINQDATVLLNAIRSGARGADDLTNYVYAITNYWTLYDPYGVVKNSGKNGYTYQGVDVKSGTYSSAPYSDLPLTNGAIIIGLLSTPELIASPSTQTNFMAVPNLLSVAQRFGNTALCYSNHVVAYVRSLSGLAAEQPPQNNQIMREDAFTYHLYCVNAAMPVNTNSYNPTAQSSYATQLAANQRELRMTFLWPQYPNGKVGAGHHTFRATIAGQLQPQVYYGRLLYFYQPQFFTNAP